MDNDNVTAADDNDGDDDDGDEEDDEYELDWNHDETKEDNFDDDYVDNDWTILNGFKVTYFHSSCHRPTTKEKPRTATQITLFSSEYP